MQYSMAEYVIEDIITATLREISSTLNEKAIHIEIEDKTKGQNAYFDKDKIGQVIINLLSNAAKFSPSESTITITMATINQHNNSDSLLSVSIADQGTGIPDSELELVFDKFIQSSKTKTGAGGTGLGLSICKEIITAHQGSICAENNTDGGATLTFTLPCS